MIRKVKSIQQILEEFPGAYFNDVGCLCFNEWENSLCTSMFQSLGGEIELSHRYHDCGGGSWIEAWLEPLPEKKKIKAYCYSKPSDHIYTFEYFWLSSNDVAFYKRVPELDIEREVEGGARMSLPENALRVLIRSNPQLTREEILKEIEMFDRDFVGSGIISEMSSNYSKYLRGWLIRAALDKRIKNREEVETREK